MEQFFITIILRIEKKWKVFSRKKKFSLIYFVSPSEAIATEWHHHSVLSLKCSMCSLSCGLKPLNRKHFHDSERQHVIGGDAKSRHMNFKSVLFYVSYNDHLYIFVSSFFVCLDSFLTLPLTPIFEICGFMFGPNILWFPSLAKTKGCMQHVALVCKKTDKFFFFLSLRSLRGPPKLSASHSNYYNLWDDLVGLTSTARNCSDVHVCVHQSTCIHMHWRESPDPTVSVTVMGTLSCTSNNKLPVESLMRVLQLWAWTPPSVKLRLLVLARKISARKDKHITYQESVWWAPKDVKKLDVRAALPWFNSWSFKRPVRIKACRQHV